MTFLKRLFGRLDDEYVEIAVPAPDGKMVTKRVPKAWWEEMVRKGSIRELPRIRVHVLKSPSPKESEEHMRALREGKVAPERSEYYSIEECAAGKDIPEDVAHELTDPSTRDLYAMTRYNQLGKEERFFVNKTFWEMIRKALDAKTRSNADTSTLVSDVINVITKNRGAEEPHRVKVHILKTPSPTELEHYVTALFEGDSTPEEPDHYVIEEWVVGKDITEEKAREFGDPGTGDLYAIARYNESGKEQTFLAKKELWDVTKQALDANTHSAEEAEAWAQDAVASMFDGREDAREKQENDVRSKAVLSLLGNAAIRDLVNQKNLSEDDLNEYYRYMKWLMLNLPEWNLHRALVNPQIFRFFWLGPRDDNGKYNDELANRLYNWARSSPEGDEPPLDPLTPIRRVA